VTRRRVRPLRLSPVVCACGGGGGGPGGVQVKSSL